MRVTKAPEERRQEMLDTAMRVFTEKGYEQTTMRDIAKEMNVVPGLCYRYYDSKQTLYNEAVTQYAKDYAAPLISILENTSRDFHALHDNIAEYFSTIADKEKYHSFFHKPENKDFSVILNHTICDLVAPHMSVALKHYSQTGEIHVSDPDGYARFLLFGISAIFDDDTKPYQQRMALVEELLKKLY